jgi:HEPN domain-containing protein
MNEDDVQAEALKWLRYAQEDLDSAETLARSDGYPRQICWLSQQCVEKALKAVLVLLQIDFPRTHDLDVLLNLIPEDWTVKAEHSSLAELSEWAVEARYPGNWPEASDTDAEAALAQATRVYQSIIQEFNSRGC